MTETNSERYGLIALIDILGTKRAGEADWQKYINAWNTFNFDYDLISAISEGDFFMFSDTIMIALPVIDGTMIDAFTKLGRILLQMFLSGIKWGLFFREVISIGKFYMIRTKSYQFAGIYYDETWSPVQKSLLIGPAVNEAECCYDKSKWIGISTMPSATKELENIYRDNSMENYFIKCDVKKYGVCKDGWAFAWPLFDDPENRLNPNKESHVNYLREKLHFYSNVEKDESIARKYQHTVQFYDDIRQKTTHI